MGVTAPALYTLCVSLTRHSAYNVDAVPPWFDTYEQMVARDDLIEVTFSNEEVDLKCNYTVCVFFLGVPAMFVTVWATVRATFADTE